MARFKITAKGAVSCTLFAATAAVLGGCMAATLPQAPAGWEARPDTAEALYRERVTDLIANRGRIDYDIISEVSGAAAPLPLKRSSSSRIDPAALAGAAEYAAKTNSSALLVWDGGALVSENYFGDTKADTLLPSKSLSKPLASIAVGRAIQLGQIDNLDQPASDFIAEWQGTEKQSMSIRQLLLMQSGLLEQGFDMNPESPLMRAYLDPYHEQYIVEQYPLTDAPGTRFAYSNASGDLIAVVIEKASGKSYDRFVGEDILAPLGAAGGTAWLNRPNGKAHSGCCMFFTAETYMKVARLLLDDGSVDGKRILPTGFVQEMRTSSDLNPHYGLGIWLGSPYLERRGFLGPDSDAPKVLHSEPFLADDVFMFDGSGSQVVYIVPSRDIVVLRTGDAPPKDIEWDNAYLLNTVLRGTAVVR